MSSHELVAKYVKEFKCEHCNGSCKCKCSSCQSDHAHNYRLIEGLKNPRPLPHEIEMRDIWENSTHKIWEEAEKWSKTTDTCAKCGGKGTVGKVNLEKLDSEVALGKITEHQKFAILKDLGRVLGLSYFT